MESAVLEQPVTQAATGQYPPRPAAPRAAGAPLTPTGGAFGAGGHDAPPPPVVHQTATGSGGQSGIPAYGTQIQVMSQSSPETYETISGVGDITGPNTQVAEIETTSHSTGSPHRTYIPTLIDDGDLSFPMFWNPADPTQAIDSSFGLEYLFQNRITTKFRMVNTDPGHQTRTCYGFVKQIGETYPVQGICTRQVVIRIAGTWTVVPSPITMTPSSATVVAAGGPGTFDVATGGVISAAWTPVSDASWITISSPTTPQTQDGPVDYVVDVNAVAAPARTGHIMIAALGLTFQIDQAAG
jgi:hypothetical protein